MWIAVFILSNANCGIIECANLLSTEYWPVGKNRNLHFGLWGKIETCIFAVVFCISKTYVISSLSLSFSIQTQTLYNVGEDVNSWGRASHENQLSQHEF